METNNPNPEQEQLTSDLKKSGQGHGGKILGIIIALVILGALFVGAVELSKRNRPSSDYKLSEIGGLEDNLQKRVLEGQLKDLQAQAEALPSKQGVTRADRFVVYAKMADIQNMLGLHNEAIASLDVIKAENVNNTRIWSAYATAYQNTNRNSEAKTAIQNAVNLDSGVAEYWVQYFTIFSDLPNDQMDAKYTEALKGTTNNIEIVKSYARFLEKVGNKEKAIIYWETARNVDPNNAGEYEKEISRLRG